MPGSATDGLPSTPSSPAASNTHNENYERLDDPIGVELEERLQAMHQPGNERTAPGLAGINRGDLPAATKAPEHDRIASVVERLDRLERVRTIDPPSLSL